MSKPVILITGAGKGIGRAIAEEWIDRSGDQSPALMVTSRTAQDLESLQKKARERGVALEYVAGDLADPEVVAQLVSRCVQTFGRIDALVNNAGVGRFGDFLDLTLEDFDFVTDTNLRSMFLLTQKVYAQMKQQVVSSQFGKGHLFFITSVAAKVPFEQSAIYCLSKFGQRGLVEVLRLYGRKDGIKVTEVLPGAVQTQMWGEVTPEMQEKFMQPEDLAPAIVDAFYLPRRTSIEELVFRPLGGDL